MKPTFFRLFLALLAVSSALVSCRFAQPLAEASASPRSPSPGAWSITVHSFHGRGKSWEGGGEYTLDSTGMVSGVTWQNGAAGPRPHHTSDPVAHPEALPELERALSNPAFLAQPGEDASADGVELHYTIHGRSGSLLLARGSEVAWPGAAEPVRLALGRVMRSSESPITGQARWNVMLNQAANDEARAQGWEWRSFTLDSNGIAEVTYFRPRSEIDGSWSFSSPRLSRPQLAALEEALPGLALSTHPRDYKPASLTLGVHDGGKAQYFISGIDGRFEPAATSFVTLLTGAFTGSGPLQDRPWMVVPTGGPHPR